MRVVGIDTSTFAGGIALLDNGQVVAEYSAYVTRRNSESLMGVLDNMLRELDWSVQGLQGVAVAIGPGSFTGTRIGVTDVYKRQDESLQEVRESSGNARAFRHGESLQLVRDPRVG